MLHFNHFTPNDSQDKFSLILRVLDKSYVWAHVPTLCTIFDELLLSCATQMSPLKRESFSPSGYYLSIFTCVFSSFSNQAVSPALGRIGEGRLCIPFFRAIGD